jgi:hypothetical protein
MDPALKVGSDWFILYVFIKERGAEDFRKFRMFPHPVRAL